jgi:phosphomannomutase
MLRCFKAYDVRGRIPDELNEELAYEIGQALSRSGATFVNPAANCSPRWFAA